jgi:hypothetical protein
MTEIALEAFAVPRATRHASMLGELVAQNQDWLEGSYYAGAAKRYNRDFLHTVRNIMRIAQRGHSLRAFAIIESDDSGGKPTERAVGIGTLIRGQAIHPAGDAHAHTLKGIDADYWLGKDVGEDLGVHKAVAQELVKRAHDLNEIGRTASEVGERWHTFATLEPGLPHQPVGFSQAMRPWGEPSRFVVPMGQEDIYDITKGGRILQAYALPLDWSSQI